MANKTKNDKSPKRPTNPDSVFVQAAFEATDDGYLAKVLSERQPAKIGTCFKETQSLDRLKAAHWQKMLRPLEGYGPEVMAYTTADIPGFQGTIPLKSLHRWMLLEAQKEGVTDITPVVRGNHRIPVYETVVLIEKPENQPAAVIDIIPGGPIHTKHGTDGKELLGGRHTNQTFQDKGFSHALVVPR